VPPACKQALSFVQTVSRQSSADGVSRFSLKKGSEAAKHPAWMVGISGHSATIQAAANDAGNRAIETSF